MYKDLKIKPKKINEGGENLFIDETEWPKFLGFSTLFRTHLSKKQIAKMSKLP